MIMCAARAVLAQVPLATKVKGDHFGGVITEQNWVVLS